MNNNGLHSSFQLQNQNTQSPSNRSNFVLLAIVSLKEYPFHNIQNKENNEILHEQLLFRKNFGKKNITKLMLEKQFIVCEMKTRLNCIKNRLSILLEISGVSCGWNELSSRLPFLRSLQLIRQDYVALDP